MYPEEFEEVGLTVVELPIEIEDNKPVYRLLLKELPTLNSAGNSRQEAYSQLVQQYQEYRSQLLEASEDRTEEEKTANLSLDELLRYYDGEVFDGFFIQQEE
ncbi:MULTISPECIES: hypothetical protein [unclassified Enterococcus]|jgi:hypothetical protein|uniref:hypothetical protein n=1 Tax=unclassified Enterococcus TaxID=2608891 RepID=UPI0004275416